MHVRCHEDEKEVQIETLNDEEMGQRFCLCYLQQFGAMICGTFGIRKCADFKLIGNRFPRPEWNRVSRRLGFCRKNFGEKNS
jgi:hypothetical protein